MVLFVPGWHELSRTSGSRHVVEPTFDLPFDPVLGTSVGLTLPHSGSNLVTKSLPAWPLATVPLVASTEKLASFSHVQRLATGAQSTTFLSHICQQR
jgi:hypothetical protein